MRIPSDTPSSVHNVRSGALQALGLRPGQTFSAQVLSHTPDGLTNLQINNQQFSLALPSKAQIGVFLKFEFQTGGTKPQIIFLGEQPKTSKTPLTPTSTTNPQTTKQIPASSSPSPQKSTTSNLNTQPAFTNNIAKYSTPTNSPISTSSPPSTPSGTASNLTSSPAPSTQANISISLPPTTKAALKLYPSQLINAKVIGTNSTFQTTLQIGQQQITANIPNSPPAGTNLQFQVQITGNKTHLILNSKLPNNSQTQATNSPTQTPSKTNPQPPITSNQTKSANINSPILTNSPPTQNLNQNSPQIQNPIAQAISQAIPANIAKQDSISALFTNLAALQNNSDKISPTIIKIAQQLENTKLNFDIKMPTGENLQKAIKQSGVFLESILAQPQTILAQQNITNIKTATQSDLKLLLLLFRSTLSKWLGEKTLPQKPTENRPNPPIKGSPPRSNFQTQPPLQPNQTPKSLAQTLLNNTDSALSRLRLFQITSLPETTARPQNINSQELNLELPFTYNGETNIIYLQINRENSSANEQEKNGWQMRFSMNLNNIGEVGADVAFRYKKINALIWADKKETANSLTKLLPELKKALLEKELDLSSIHVRYGAPMPKENLYPTKGNVK